MNLHMCHADEWGGLAILLIYVSQCLPCKGRRLGSELELGKMWDFTPISQIMTLYLLIDS